MIVKGRAGERVSKDVYRLRRLFIHLMSLCYTAVVDIQNIVWSIRATANQKWSFNICRGGRHRQTKMQSKYKIERKKNSDTRRKKCQEIHAFAAFGMVAQLAVPFHFAWVLWHRKIYIHS